jgi:hypothetical protein
MFKESNTITGPSDILVIYTSSFVCVLYKRIVSRKIHACLCRNVAKTQLPALRNASQKSVWVCT